MEPDYLTFRDDLLVHLVDDIEPPGIPSVRLVDVAHRHGMQFYPSWIEAVGRDFENAGYGKIHVVDGVEYFQINGGGFARATELRRDRRPRPVLDRLTGDRSQKLANVGNFVIAILALIVAAIALVE